MLLNAYTVIVQLLSLVCRTRKRQNPPLFSCTKIILASLLKLTKKKQDLPSGMLVVNTLSLLAVNVPLWIKLAGVKFGLSQSVPSLL